MINLTDNAKKHLDHYLQQVRTCLQDCLTVDADEVEQNIKEHIESELQDSSEPVSFDTLDDILKRLGSPQQWLPEEEIAWWRKMILRLRTGPEDWRLAYMSIGLLLFSLLSGRPRTIFLGPFVILRGSVQGILLLASFILARVAISMTRDKKELGSQKWLLYPPLLIVYVPLLILLLLWPTVALGIIADQFDRLDNIDVFPWNLPDDPARDAYWLIAIMFMTAGTALWCLIVGMLQKIKPQISQILFRPFAEKIKTKWVNWFIGIMACLLILCSTTGILMIKYHGWYYFLKKLTG